MENKPLGSFKENLNYYKDEVNNFLVRNEVKEKVSSFASTSYGKAINILFRLISFLLKFYRFVKNAKNIKSKKKALISLIKQKTF